MATPKYATLKGDFFIKEKGSAENFYFFGNSQEATFEMGIEKATLESSGNERGTLASEETSRTATFSMTPNSLATRNLKLYFYSKGSETQASATDQAFTLPAMVEGEMFRFAHVNVTNVNIEDLVAGTDYKVLAKGGALVAMKTIVAGKEGTYDAAGATKVGVFTGDGMEYEVYYVSEKTGKTVHFRRWKPDPAQSVALIGNDFASFPLSGECLIDESIPEGPLGRFAVVTDATDIA